MFVVDRVRPVTTARLPVWATSLWGRYEGPHPTGGRTGSHNLIGRTLNAFTSSGGSCSGRAIGFLALTPQSSEEKPTRRRVWHRASCMLTSRVYPQEGAGDAESLCLRSG